MIFLFRTNRTDFSRSIYFVQGITEAQTTNQISGVSSGTYVIVICGVVRSPVTLQQMRRKSL